MNEAAQINDTEKQGTPRFYYTVAGNDILLEADIKTEIIEQRDVFPIPHAPTWCQGMISLRGKLIPVANLHTLFDNAKASKSNWLLVVEQAPFPQLAIRIDQLPKQQLLNNEHHENIDEQKFPAWLVSSILIGQQTLYEADHSRLFEQLIQENEADRSDMQETEPNPNQDSSGSNA